MKNIAHKIFSPILNLFEKNNDEYVYQRFSRKIVLFIGAVFIFLAAALPIFMPQVIQMGYWFVMLVFGLLGVVALTVGILGSDKAVAKLLGSR
jgi:hypothetical protein